MLMERKEDYARDMTREMGKILKENSRRRAGSHRHGLLTWPEKAGGCSGRPRRQNCRTSLRWPLRTPIGVCAMITPWNFPMAIPSWKLLPAIVCGNTCVIKPAQDTPLSTFNLVRTLADAGVPKGVINIVTGFGSSVGTPMTEHPEVRVVSLTGSTEVAASSEQLPQKTFKHCSLELGGKNPMIVLDDANLDLAIEGGLWGGFGTTGQRLHCHQPHHHQKGSYGEFVERYVNRAKALKVGNGLDEAIDMGQRSMPASLAPISNYVEVGRSEGAKLKCGGNKLTKGEYANGYFMEPTVFIDGRSQDAHCPRRNLWPGGVDHSLRQSGERH